MPSRVLLAALALAALLGSPDPAAAEDCLCIGPEELFDADAAIALEALESPDPLAPDPAATAAREIAGHAAARRGGRAPVLWCRSADDPRCSRDDSGEAPLRITLDTAPVVTLTALPRIGAPAVARVRFDHTTRRPSGGFATRLDRPPRA